MRKFKSVFYPVYIVSIIIVLIISFNIYESLELFKRWGWFRYFSDLPFIGRNIMLFLSLLMSIEIALENINVFSLRRKQKELKQEVETLKAKLYDQSNIVSEEKGNSENQETDE